MPAFCAASGWRGKRQTRSGIGLPRIEPPVVAAFIHCQKAGENRPMTTTHLITATELESMGSDTRFELMQGVLCELSPSGYRSNGMRARLFHFCSEIRNGGDMSAARQSERRDRCPAIARMRDDGCTTQESRDWRPFRMLR
jgi:hypothetical protein